MKGGDVLGPLNRSHTKHGSKQALRSFSTEPTQAADQSTEVVHESPSIRKRLNRLASSWLGAFWRSKLKQKATAETPTKETSKPNAADWSDALSLQEPSSTQSSSQQTPQKKSSQNQPAGPESDSESSDQDAQIGTILSGKVDSGYDSDSSAEYWRTIDSPYHISKQTIYDGQIFYEGQGSGSVDSFPTSMTDFRKREKELGEEEDFEN